MCLSSVYYELDKAGGARSWKKREVEKEKQRERETESETTKLITKKNELSVAKNK